ncbi:hypothetical protein [Nitrospira sp. M1]
MKTSPSHFSVLVLAMAAAFSGCDNSHTQTQQEPQVSAKDVEKTVKEAIEVTKSFAENKFDEYRKSIEMKINSLDQKHVELSNHAKRAGEEANAEVHEILDAMEKKKQDLLRQMEELKSTSGEAVEDLKTGIDQTLVELDKSYDTALARYSKS